MKKVLIIGCSGAGKSTFARKLAAKTGLPLYYLDMIWHLPDRTTLPREEFDKRLEEIMKSDSWIIDGNYTRTLPMRLKEADTVFLFEIPVEQCLEGAIERLNHERVDMPWHVSEISDEFRQWILNFTKDRLPVIEEILSHYTGTIYRITTREHADNFIRDL